MMDAFEAEPLVAELRPRYPRLMAALADLPDGARQLRRIVDLDRAWVRQQCAPQAPPTVVTHVADALAQAPRDVLTFDIIYAGGGLNLLNAAVMARQHGRRVVVFDRFTAGAVHREWNISQPELRELVAVGLLTPDEMARVIQRRYAEGLVHFHNQGIRFRPSDLWLRGVLDVAVDADALAAHCLRAIRAADPGNVILNEITFEHAFVDDRRVVVQARDAAGNACWFAAPLLIDGMGATSPVACQLNCGAPFTLVCPTVGTVARGYRIDPARSPGSIDPSLGEVLITTTHARDGRQLIWEAFPGQGDQAAIYLFYYAPTGQGSAMPESVLLPLFEDFFTLLPGYKDTANVQVIKPVYGFIPAGYKAPALRARARKVVACDRVLSLGDAAALQSPLTFCGFGSNVRNLRRITDLLDLALTHDRLRAADLRHIRAAEAVPALARAFSGFMMAKPPARERPEQVNETLNVFCAVLHQLGPRASREFYQDRVRWWDYTRLVLRTAITYPRIFPLTLRTLSWADGAAWIGAYLAFTATAARNAVGQAVILPLAETSGARRMGEWLWRAAPRMAWRLATAGASVRQALRVRAMPAPTAAQMAVETAPRGVPPRSPPAWTGLR
jgi:lycopene cyclase CruA